MLTLVVGGGGVVVARVVVAVGAGVVVVKFVDVANVLCEVAVVVLQCVAEGVVVPVAPFDEVPQDEVPVWAADCRGEREVVLQVVGVAAGGVVVADPELCGAGR